MNDWFTPTLFIVGGIGLALILTAILYNVSVDNADKVWCAEHHWKMTMTRNKNFCVDEHGFVRAIER